MRKLKLLFALILTVWLPCTALFAQTSTNDQKQTITMEAWNGPDISSSIGYGNCQWLHPYDEPNETLLSEPDYVSDKLYYYAAKYGDAKDNIHSMVIDESKGTGTGYDTLYVDLDNDNRIDPNKEKFSFQPGTTSGAEPTRVTLTISSGGKIIPYSFDFTAFPYKDENNPEEKIHANARESTIFTGQANFGGKTYKIAIADLNSNGLFNDVEKGNFHGDRFFVDLSGDDKFSYSLQSAAFKESYPYSQYTQIDGQWYCIEAALSGTTINISQAEPQLASVKAQKEISAASLWSDVQAQTLNFSDGSAQAITGDYELASLELSITDANEGSWTCRGGFKTDKPKLNIAPGTEAVIPDPLPLQISIEPIGDCPSDTVTLKPSITGMNGCTFGCPRSSKRPEGGFEIQDQQGKVVSSEAFEYG